MVKQGRNSIAVKFGRRRRAALRRCTTVGKTDMLLVSRPVDVTYLSGFTGDDSWLLVGAGWAILITDGRYAEQAHRQCGDIDIHIRAGSMIVAAVELAELRKVRCVAIQADHMTVRQRSRLSRKAPSWRIHDSGEALPALRIVKDALEIRAIRKAVRVAEKAFRELLAGGRKVWLGRSERSLAAELDYRMRLGGAQSPSFETIVAVGANASKPHYRPGGAVVAMGDAVLIDWGAKVDGYCSDLTRVVFAGRIPPEIAEIYNVVLRAQRAGIAAIRPGVSCRTVDAAARAVITAAGYGDKFVHSLGHGLGLNVHEGPGLARSVRTRLRGGMIVTVEPGIYLPGAGGVRIEDDVLVTARGRSRLSSLSRNPVAMVVQ